MIGLPLAEAAKFWPPSAPAGIGPSVASGGCARLVQPPMAKSLAPPKTHLESFTAYSSRAYATCTWYPKGRRGFGRYNRTHDRPADARDPGSRPILPHTYTTDRCPRTRRRTKHRADQGARGGREGAAPLYIQPPSYRYWSVPSSAAPPALGGAHVRVRGGATRARCEAQPSSVASHRLYSSWLTLFAIHCHRSR